MRKDFLPFARPCFSQAEIEAAAEVIRSGHLTTGPKVTEFEERFCEYLGEGFHAAALNSCTAGLFLGLLSHGIGPQDEVIVPTWTFVATAHVVLWTGARPVLCDVEESSLNIDVRAMEKSIGKRTKAIIPVHFAGYPCAMDEICRIAKKHKLVVIEDAAHACGTAYKGKKIGGFGDLTAFSFYATKNLACGEGGMVVSRDRKTIEKIRKLSYFGINKRAFDRYTQKGSWYYEIEELGYKYNMDSIHAAIGLVQLAKLEEMNLRRREIAGMYRRGLDKRIRFTEDSEENFHNYHLFLIRIDKEIIPRDEFIGKLKERNIGCSVHFIPLHRHPFYKKISKKKFPVADKAYREAVSIPLFPGMSDQDVEYVIDNVNQVLKGGG